jgi:hypothetical protein
VRKRVGKSGGRYIVNKPKTPEKNPTAGNQNQTKDIHDLAWAKVRNMARKNPK